MAKKAQKLNDLFSSVSKWVSVDGFSFAAGIAISGALSTINRFLLGQVPIKTTVSALAFCLGLAAYSLACGKKNKESANN